MTSHDRLAEAYAYCEGLARDHYENFPVASFLLPRRLRRHVAALYAFARVADDYADEPGAGMTAERRLALLEDWVRQLDAAFRGQADHPIFIALADSAERLGLPYQLFRDLVTAFQMDVTTTRYPAFNDVLFYCRHSANPVGRLVLLIFGHRDPELHTLSDHICTALQLANFWQDVSVDLEKGRIYVPQEEFTRFGCSETDFLARKATPEIRGLMKLQVERTRALFEQGRALPDRVTGRLSLELRLTWLGGNRILDRVEGNGYDVFSRRPTLTRWDWTILAARALVA